MCRHALGRSRKKINDRLPVWLVDLPSLPPQPPEFPSNKASAAEETVASQPTPTTAETLAAPPPRDPPRDARPLIDASRLGEISKELETALAATPAKIDCITVVSLPALPARPHTHSSPRSPPLRCPRDS